MNTASRGATLRLDREQCVDFVELYESPMISRLHSLEHPDSETARASATP
jgi:hypothetical protein